MNIVYIKYTIGKKHHHTVKSTNENSNTIVFFIRVLWEKTIIHVDNKNGNLERVGETLNAFWIQFSSNLEYYKQKLLEK